MNGLSSLVEAKKIYTAQLCKILGTQLYRGLSIMWDYSKNEINPYIDFQKRLSKVPTWNSVVIEEKYGKIKENACNYLDSLIDIVFVINGKILTSVTQKNVNISVPKSKDFIHYCYIQCAYHIYTVPHIFDENVPLRDRFDNVENIKKLIKKSIEETIENLLPMESLIKECFSGYESVIHKENIIYNEEKSNMSSPGSPGSSNTQEFTVKLSEEDEKELDYKMNKLGMSTHSVIDQIMSEFGLDKDSSNDSEMDETEKEYLRLAPTDKLDNLNTVEDEIEDYDDEEDYEEEESIDTDIDIDI